MEPIVYHSAIVAAWSLSSSQSPPRLCSTGYDRWALSRSDLFDLLIYLVHVSSINATLYHAPLFWFTRLSFRRKVGYALDVATGSRTAALGVVGCCLVFAVLRQPWLGWLRCESW